MGAIALVGGDEFGQNCIPMDQELLRRIPTRPPRVVILPTAAAHQRPHLAAENGIRYFKELGAAATSAMILDRRDADDHRCVDQLKEANLLYITGGDPWHLLESLRDSAATATIKELKEQNMLIAGSSAGAMVLGEKMRYGKGANWIQGLGLAPRVVVLPHHERVNKADTELLLGMLESHITILGVEGATACVNDGDDIWQVIGSGSVTAYAGGKGQRYETGQSFLIP